MRYREALRIIDEYIHVDLDGINNRMDLAFSRQCGKSENVLEKVYYRLWLYMKAQFVVRRYRLDRSKNRKGAR